jgi:hypothetical protein
MPRSPESRRLAELMRRFNKGLLSEAEAAQLNGLRDAVLVRFIRDRYRCTQEEAGLVLARLAERSPDAAATALHVTDQGDLHLERETTTVLDTLAAGAGLTPTQ